ncbi:MAG TPA: multidrug transporter, partial [Paenibacillaceae bacterium]|nr:multidrug transporter [Paenibacillaceae bacterium]
MAKRFFPFLIILFLTLSTLTGCGQKETSVYSGTIEGIEIPIQSELGGPLKEINSAEGDEVKKGQVLLKLDDRTYALQLEEAKAGVAAAQA